MSTGFDLDHVGGSTASSFCADHGRDVRGNAAQLDQPVDCEHADAAAIGQDRQPLARRRFDAAQRLGAVEQFAQVRYPQDAGAPESGIVDRVRPPPVRRYGSQPPFAPCAMRPDLTTTTGLTLAAARAADMNLRASLIASI